MQKCEILPLGPIEPKMDILGERKKCLILPTLSNITLTLSHKLNVSLVFRSL